MKSIQALHAPLLLSLHAKLKHKQQLITPEVVPWLSNDGPTELTLRSQRFRYSPPTKAMHNPILLDLTSPSRSTDMSAFLQISALLLFFYWISNFVVPDIISKYYKFDEVGENGNARDERPVEDEETEPTSGSKTRSSRKKRSFNGTKT